MKKTIAILVVITILAIPTIALATNQDNPEVACPNQETVSEWCNHEEEQPPEEQPPVEEEDTPEEAPAKPEVLAETTESAPETVEVFEGK